MKFELSGRTKPRCFRRPRKGERIETDQGQVYFLGSKIGRGAFGAVFECFDEWGNDLVAKVLLPQNRSYELVREVCLQELENLENLRHPNITYIYDAFEFKDTLQVLKPGLS